MAEINRIHKAAPMYDNAHCITCGQPVRQAPGGQGPLWVHAGSGTVAAPSPPGLEDLRVRIVAALEASIDWCARCKVCDHQVDAVMAVVEEALGRR